MFPLYSCTFSICATKPIKISVLDWINTLHRLKSLFPLFWHWCLQRFWMVIASFFPSLTNHHMRKMRRSPRWRCTIVSDEHCNINNTTKHFLCPFRPNILIRQSFSSLKPALLFFFSYAHLHFFSNLNTPPNATDSNLHSSLLTPDSPMLLKVQIASVIQFYHNLSIGNVQTKILNHCQAPPALSYPDWGH